MDLLLLVSAWHGDEEFDFRVGPPDPHDVGDDQGPGYCSGPSGQEQGGQLILWMALYRS
jgi:hypothetical protein